MRISIHFARNAIVYRLSKLLLRRRGAERPASPATMMRAAIAADVVVIAVVVVAAALASVRASASGGDAWNEEERLARELLGSGQYDAATRPAKNVSQPTVVDVQTQIFGILSLVGPVLCWLSQAISLLTRQQLAFRGSSRSRLQDCLSCTIYRSKV